MDACAGWHGELRAGAARPGHVAGAYDGRGDPLADLQHSGDGDGAAGGRAECGATAGWVGAGDEPGEEAGVHGHGDGLGRAVPPLHLGVVCAGHQADAGAGRDARRPDDGDEWPHPG